MSRQSTHGRTRRFATAFAPATVANVAVGFDVLGFAVEGAGDRVRVSIEPAEHAPGAVFESVDGVVVDLPTDPALNTAAVAIEAMVNALGLESTFRIRLEKGIPLGSGMGGSAASAVGAVVAANALLAEPLPRQRLLPFALAGEAAASGAPHADNAAPCLFGGLTAVVATDPVEVIELPVPPDLTSVLVRPELRIDTRAARAVLREHVSLGRHVEQSMRLTGFLIGCFRADADLVARSMQDLIVGPQRSPSITGFERSREAALAAGALGFGIAGSGPSVFAWVRKGRDVAAVERAIGEAFLREGVASQSWVSPVGCPGARIEDEAGGASRA